MSSGFATSGWIAFANVEIDVTGHRLLVNGEEVALERKAFSVLVLLARSPGRVFSRDEILDAVWGHSHVTPGVLTRIITLLRHALGENAGHAHFLSTVHGVGYRFDAQVGDVEYGPAPSATADMSAAPSSEKDDIDAGMAGAIGPAPGDPMDTPSQRPPRRGRSRLVLLLCVGLVLLGVSLFWRTRQAGITPLATTTAASMSAPAPVPGGSPFLIVMPLRVIGGTRADAAYADGIGEELISLLARVEGLRVMARTSATLARDSGDDLPTLARRLGATQALEGSLRHDGAKFRVSLRLTDTVTQQTLWTRQYDRALTDPLALERDVAEAVTAALALKFGTQMNAELARNEDPKLYLRYLQARYLLTDGRVGTKTAVEAFRALVADAPDYGRAHAGLALALNPPSFDSPSKAKRSLSEALTEATKALQLDSSLPDAYTVLADAACRKAEWETCMAMCAHVIELAPADATFRMQLGWHWMTLGYRTRALNDIRIAYASDPLSPNAKFAMSRVLDALGRHDEALPYHQAMSAFPLDTHNRWFNAVWRGQLVEAKSLILATPRWHASYAAVTAALADPSLWPAARQRIAESEQPDGLFNWTRILDPHPDIPRDIAGLEATWRSGYSSFGAMLWSPQLANHRRDPAFQDYLRRNHIVDYWRAHGWPEQCRPVGNEARCD